MAIAKTQDGYLYISYIALRRDNYYYAFNANLFFKLFVNTSGIL